MSSEQFRTQVLLLHSEQSALDNMRAGLNDRYAVHCASSGSEALSTLGETPIHVIVSAQNLPGMSGLEALREAKKRSPETIGILLAGDANVGIEALVGANEVFQIVRGFISPESLTELIDSATQQMRLLALAESANDQSATANDTIAEHIVMETSENGATIISDGSGRLPALEPEKVSSAPHVGSRAVDILILSKDQQFLKTVRDSARGMHDVHVATSLAQAGAAVRKHRVGVIVVDSGMVGSNVEKLTLHLRQTVQRLVAIVAGRRDDGEMLMDLINRGNVYRFLLKPVSPGRARLAIEASVKYHLEAPDSAFLAKNQATAAKPQPEPKKTAKSTPIAIARKPAGAPSPPAAKPVPGPEPISAPGEAPPESLRGTSSGLFATRSGVTRPAGKAVSDLKATRGGVAEATVAKPEDSGGSKSGKWKILGIGATTLATIAVVALWMLRETPEPEPATASAPIVLPVPDPAPVVESSAANTVAPADPVAELIDEARAARDAGQIFDPPGSNAIDLYLSARELAPENTLVATELTATLEQALIMAEAALLERRSDEAAYILSRVATADPANARLPFLDAQLMQIALQGHLEDARAALREYRFEDAAGALERARSLNVADTSMIDSLADDLQNARSQQRAEEMLAKANTRLDEGSLISPANDSARYYYELVLSNDPENVAAAQGLAVVASKLVLRAREEIDNSDFNAAEDLLAQAMQLDPSSDAIVASTSALRAARDREAEAQRVAAERRAAAQRAEAERRAAARAAAEQAAAAKAAAEQAAAEKAAAEQAAAAKAAAEQAAAKTASATSETSGPPTAPVNDGGSATVPLTPVSVSALNRIKYVAPKFPRAAQRRNISGWVDVVFTVMIDGSVSNIDVHDSNPGDTFVEAATSAIKEWKFEPVIENGVAVEKLAAVRLMFAVE